MAKLNLDELISGAKSNSSSTNNKGKTLDDILGKIPSSTPPQDVIPPTEEPKKKSVFSSASAGGSSQSRQDGSVPDLSDKLPQAPTTEAVTTEAPQQQEQQPLSMQDEATYDIAGQERKLSDMTGYGELSPEKQLQEKQSLEAIEELQIMAATSEEEFSKMTEQQQKDFILKFNELKQQLPTATDQQLAVLQGSSPMGRFEYLQKGELSEPVIEEKPETPELTQELANTIIDYMFTPPQDRQLAEYNKYKEQGIPEDEIPKLMAADKLFGKEAGIIDKNNIPYLDFSRFEGTPIEGSIRDMVANYGIGVYKEDPNEFRRKLDRLSDLQVKRVEDWDDIQNDFFFDVFDYNAREQAQDIATVNKQYSKNKGVIDNVMSFYQLSAEEQALKESGLQTPEQQAQYNQVRQEMAKLLPYITPENAELTNSYISDIAGRHEQYNEIQKTQEQYIKSDPKLLDKLKVQEELKEQVETTGRTDKYNKVNTAAAYAWNRLIDASKGVLTMAGGVSGVVTPQDEYTAFERRIENSKVFLDEYFKFKVPEEIELLYDNGDINWNTFPAKASSTIMDMAIMLRGGAEVSKGLMSTGAYSQAIARRIGLFSSSYLVIFPDNYDRLLETPGVSKAGAFNLSFGLTAIEAAIELIGTQRGTTGLFTGEVKDKIIKETSSELIKKGTKEYNKRLFSNVVDKVVKIAAKETAIENVEEILQGVSNNIGMFLINKHIDNKAFDVETHVKDSGQLNKFDLMSRNELKETVVLTTTASGLLGLGGAVRTPSRSKIYKASLYDVVVNGRTDNVLGELRENYKDNPHVEKIVRDLQAMETIYKGLQGNISAENTPKAVELANERENLKQELEQTDEALKPPIQERIKEINEEIANIDKPKQEVGQTDQANVQEKTVEEVTETTPQATPQATDQVTEQATVETLKQELAEIEDGTSPQEVFKKAKESGISINENAELKQVYAEKQKAFQEAQKQEKQKLEQEYEAAEQEALSQPEQEVMETEEATELTQQEEQVKKTALETVKPFTDKIRSGKISKIEGYKASTGFDAVWDMALETIATSVETGAKIVDAVNNSIVQIRDTDWYKGLTSDKQKAFEQDFAKHIQQQYDDTVKQETPEKQTVLTSLNKAFTKVKQDTEARLKGVKSQMDKVAKRSSREARKQTISEQKSIIESIDNFIKENRTNFKYIRGSKIAPLVKKINDLRVKLDNGKQLAEKDVNKVIEYMDGLIKDNTTRASFETLTKKIEKSSAIKLKKDSKKQEGTRTVQEWDVKQKANEIANRKTADNISDNIIELVQQHENGEITTDQYVERLVELEYAHSLARIKEITDSFDKMNYNDRVDALRELSEINDNFQRYNQEWLEQTKREETERKAKKEAAINNATNAATRARITDAPKVISEALGLFKDGGNIVDYIHKRTLELKEKARTRLLSRVSKLQEQGFTDANYDKLEKLLNKSLKSKLEATAKEYNDSMRTAEGLFHPMKVFENFEGIIETVFGLGGKKLLNDIKAVTSDAVNKARRNWERTINDAQKQIKDATNSLKGNFKLKELGFSKVYKTLDVQQKKLGIRLYKKDGSAARDIDTMSYMNIAYLYLQLQQEIGANGELTPSEFETLMANTYTTESIAELKEHVDRIVNENKELKDFVAKQSNFYKSMYDKINKVYRKLYKTDLPKRQNYAPRSAVNMIENFANMELDADGNITDNTMGGLYVSPRFTKKSKVAGQQVNLKKDALIEMHKYAKDAADFISFAEVKRDLVGVLKSNDVQKAISNIKGGKKLSKIVDKFLDNIPRVKPSGEIGGIGFRLLGNAVLSVLTMNPSIFPKQVASMVNGIMSLTPKKRHKIPGVKEVEWALKMGNVTQWADYIKNFYSSAFVAQRIKSGFDKDLAAFNDPEIIKSITAAIGFGRHIPKVVGILKKYVAGGLITAGDIGAFLGYFPIYTETKKSKIKEYLEQGYSKEVADELATQDAVDVVATQGSPVQQSKYPENLSYYQLGKTSRWFPYMTTRIQYMQQLIKAMRNIRRGDGTMGDARRIALYGGVNYIIYNYISQLAYSLMKGVDDDEEKKEDKEDKELTTMNKIGVALRYGSNIIQGVPVIYDLLQYASDELSDKKGFGFSPSSTVEMVEQKGKELVRIHSIMQDEDGKMKDIDELTDKDWNKLNKIILSQMDFTGVSFKNVKKILNMIEHGNAYYEPDFKDTKKSSSQGGVITGAPITGTIIK